MVKYDRASVMHDRMVWRRGFLDICPLCMRSAAWTTAFESGQTMVGLSASIIQCEHCSIAVAAATASISHGFQSAMYELSLALTNWTGIEVVLS